MSTGNIAYLHGYSEGEKERLRDQGSILESYVYPPIEFPEKSHVLELGCGVGAQTEILLRRFPTIHITAVDYVPEQIVASRTALKEKAMGRVTWEVADGTRLPYPEASFDGVFLCWVLEHVPNPAAVLKECFRALKPGGVIYATEVFNESLYVSSWPKAIYRYWRSFNRTQKDLGGNPNIGPMLGNLFLGAGFSQVKLTPITYLADQQMPEEKRRAFLEYWKQLLLSARSQLEATGPISASDTEAMIADFENLKKDREAVFYTAAMQGRAFKPVT